MYVKYNIVLCLLLTIAEVSSYAPIEYMDSNCNGTLYVAAANRLKLDSYMVAGFSDNCQVQLKAADVFKSSIAVRISFLHVHVPCDEGIIVINGFGTAVTSWCGYGSPSISFKSLTDTGTVKFQKNSGVSVFTSSFDLLITEVNYGFCDTTEFQCDNGDCINKILLTCDGNNNCGDDSDEAAGICIWTYPVIVGVSLGAVGFFAMIVVCVVTLRYRKRRVYTHQNIAQPFYIQPHQQYGVKPQQQYGVQPQLQYGGQQFAEGTPSYQESITPTAISFLQK
ncbi:hypothetical protein SNE40_018823 [Patella caerulea]|uniref:CUB domain-containing protein n=1 Tax=Patella caerulea TaxID=87958 RepID=A0AAN8J7S2_PATCE